MKIEIELDFIEEEFELIKFFVNKYDELAPNFDENHFYWTNWFTDACATFSLDYHTKNKFRDYGIIKFGRYEDGDDCLISCEYVEPTVFCREISKKLW